MCWELWEEGKFARGHTAENPRLIYAKVSSGMNLLSKYSQNKGHDLNLLALSGVKIWLQIGETICTTRLLGFLSWRGSQTVGVVMALSECARSGKAQTWDADVIAGAAG